MSHIVSSERTSRLPACYAVESGCVVRPVLTGTQLSPLGECTWWSAKAKSCDGFDFADRWFF